MKSEALSSEQRDLFQETVETDQAAIEAETEHTAPTARRKRERAGRQALPPHLPRVEIRHEPDTCACGQCGQNLVQIGEDISEQLDVEPATFTIIRPQYACRVCETITAAVIDDGMATAGLLAWVAVSKHTDLLPLYRIDSSSGRWRRILATLPGIRLPLLLILLYHWSPPVAQQLADIGLHIHAL